MSGTTRDTGPGQDDGASTENQSAGDGGSTTVRVVDRRADSPDGSRRDVPVRTETKREQGMIVELDPWPLVSIGMLLGAIVVVLLIHLLGMV